MKFGPTPLREALGAIAVHSLRTKATLIRKGTIISSADIAALEADGIEEIVTARLEAGDVSENEAAGTLAEAIAEEGIQIEPAFTGRANLYAGQNGILLIERDLVDQFNRVDESVTLATLTSFRPVAAGEMIGTVKIIPFAISGEIHRAAMATAKPLMKITPYKVKSVGVISTLLPGLANKVVEKTVRVTADRIRPAGASIKSDLRINHSLEEIVKAIRASIAAKAELVIIFGASAIADRRDVIPTAIIEAGGSIEHFGMPVDPGNLVLIGNINGVPVLGAPGCARSPKENGFDWLLSRILAGLPIKRDEVTTLGVGGLLIEIASRPQPRSVAHLSQTSSSFAAVVLAAGRGTRMQGENKLLAELNGKPVLRYAVEAALDSKASPVIVVTGHDGQRVAETLHSLDVKIVDNLDFGEGLSTSLSAGISALPKESDAAVILLGDMPDVSSALIDKIGSALNSSSLIAVPVRNGKRGNPVAWSRRFFEQLKKLEGDTGAKHLIAAHQESVVEIPADDDGIFFDIDTDESLVARRNEGLVKTARKL